MSGDPVKTVVRDLDQERLEALAERLAVRLQGEDVVLLEGGLGAGKTTFARALIRHLAGAPIEVPSPTFTLVQDYELGALAIRHADLYRVGDPMELVELGLDRVEPGTALLVEWPERGGDVLPEGLVVRFTIRGFETRDLELEAEDAWRERISSLIDV
ncbi:MAG: tRNA (adenosine(37)-N6)-threonylcarbamoyltransferase complex ATPase subunit type 1 TsaE [Geminicoccaceae bacterium]|nr:tRNA (adenosine(37)-N6)-threonylcarbamoyltransferase complex ATPase subunit type 1 TsaE [Geminicoccaceae bacterium]